MKITLTKGAERNFTSIKQYIEHHWGNTVAEAFEQKTTDFFRLLKNFPEMGSIEVVDKQIRAFQLTKQTAIFYRVKGENIIILTFFDVRQNPQKKLL